MINYYNLLASLYMHASKPIPRIPPARTWIRTERSIVSKERKQCPLASPSIIAQRYNATARRAIAQPDPTIYRVGSDETKKPEELFGCVLVQ